MTQIIITQYSSLFFFRFHTSLSRPRFSHTESNAQVHFAHFAHFERFAHFAQFEQKDSSMLQGVAR